MTRNVFYVISLRGGRVDVLKVLADNLLPAGADIQLITPHTPGSPEFEQAMARWLWELEKHSQLDLS